MRTAAPLYGLVLAGGRSTRMRRDKAALSYAGRSQLERAVELLAAHVLRAYVSVRADQGEEPLRARFATIADRIENVGPVAGLLSAQATHPEGAWLVLACDLPMLDDATLAHLVRGRDPERLATAYRSSHDGLPEPLCAIYEPRSHEPLSAYLAAGRSCPRKFLLQSEVRLLDEPNPRALDNVNTPEEYGAAMAALDQSGAKDKHISVQYYALLREQAGRREETLLTRAHDARELYALLRARYPFSLGPEHLRVAINAEFAEWSTPLKDGDAVVFIPPVAGG